VQKCYLQCESCTHRLTNEDLDNYCELNVFPQKTVTAIDDQESAKAKHEEIAECMEYELNEDFNPCETCEGCTVGLQIEEIEKPSGVTFGETFEFKTIMGTNDFYDLTTKRARKSKDFNPLLARAWKIKPQMGANMLLGLTKLAQSEGKTLETSEKVKEVTETYKKMHKDAQKEKVH